jgi:hexosaminidase
MLGESFLLTEVEPISQNLSALGAAGLAALDYIDRGERAPDVWKTEQLAIIEQAKTQKAQVLLMVAPSVQKLVEASAGQSLTH